MQRAQIASSDAVTLQKEPPSRLRKQGSMVGHYPANGNARLLADGEGIGRVPVRLLPFSDLLDFVYCSTPIIPCRAHLQRS